MRGAVSYTHLDVYKRQALYLSATKTNHDLEAALRLMQSYDPSMFSAMLDLSTASAKQTVHDLSLIHI